MPKGEAHARGLKPRHYTWVDTKKLDVYKARFTCAGVKKKGKEADGKTFSPTPQEASQKLLDLYALRYGYCTQSADIKSAFLIGKDPGTADGDPVVMRPPPEAQQFFDRWLQTQTRAIQASYPNGMDSALMVVQGNLYGRRTAGAVFRDELEEILVNLPGLKLIRGTRDACVYYDSSTKLLLLHHVDDVRVAGPRKVRLSFFVELSKRVPLKQGPEEGIGAKIDVLGRSRYRLEDATVSVPSEKYTDNFLAALDVQDCKSSPVPSKQWD